MESALVRKEHESTHFIEHTLLDTDLMGLARADWDFPKSVVVSSVGNGGTEPEHNNGYAPVKHSLPTNLPFHNEYFQYVNKHVVPGEVHHPMEHVPVPPVGPPADTVVVTQARSYDVEKHAETAVSAVVTSDFLNLNGSFLTDATHNHVGHVNAPVATYPAHAIEPTVPMHVHPTLDEEDLLYGPDTRKALPHKKRISRKLRGTLNDFEPVVEAPPTSNLGNDIVATVPYTHLVVPNHKQLIYTCEICGYAANAQIDFFAHLKQHYEPHHVPPGPPLIQTERSLNSMPKDCDSLDTVMHRKVAHTQHDDEQAKLDQVLRAVELDFDHFRQQQQQHHHHHHQQHHQHHQHHQHPPQPQHHHHHQHPPQPQHHLHQQHPPQPQHHLHHQSVPHDVGVVLAQPHEAMTHTENHPPITSHSPVDNSNANTHPCYGAATDEMSLNSVNVVSSSGVVDDVEFSDTEDMLEGIRNVVDKVSFEDTCDDLDLITSNALRSNWITGNNFSDINYRNCESLISGQFCQLLLVGEPQPHPHAAPTQPPLPPQSSPPATTAAIHQPSNIGQPSVLPVRHNTPSPPTLLSLPVATNGQLPYLVNNQAILANNLTSNQVAGMRLEEPTTADKQMESAKPLSPLVLGQSHSGMQSPPAYTEMLLPAHATVPTTTVIQDTAAPPTSPPALSNHSPSTPADSDNDKETLTPLVAPSALNKKTTQRPTKLKVRMPAKIVGIEKKSYTCTKCDREFNSQNALKYHNRTHTQDRPYKCDKCGNSFFAFGALKTHLLTHTGEKPFECEFCKRKFGRFGDLRYHVESKHNDVKSHMCEYCGKSFSRKYSLVLHRRIHTSERNFSCDYCSKSFRASCYLKSHMKIHTGEKPFPCTVCEKPFRVLGDMRRHMRIHSRPATVPEETEITEKTTPKRATKRKRKEVKTAE